MFKAEHARPSLAAMDAQRQHNMSEECGASCARLSARYATRILREDAQAEMMVALAKAEASSSFERMRSTVKAGVVTQRAKAAFNQRNVCGLRSNVHSAVFPNRSREILVTTLGKPYRYYSLVECDGPGSTSPMSACMVYKNRPEGSIIYNSVLSNGTTLRAPGEPLFRASFKYSAKDEQRRLTTDERHIAHNLAVVHLGGGEYAMAGGLGPNLEAQSRSTDGGGIAGSGIRFTRGRGWPWSPRTWTMPKVVITAQSPPGCMDFRLGRLPPETLAAWQGGDVPRLQPLCEFDGRLSLVMHRSRFRLYARANLLEGAVSGGRYVQTTASNDGASNWTSWRPIQIRSVPAGLADIYFFHAQINPVDPTTLLALFPMSQPPYACIGMAFSVDGIRFSEPINLQSSAPVWRTTYIDGSGPLEWRNADHPVAGAVLRGDEIWFFIHHAVYGTSMQILERNAQHVALYRLHVDEVRRMMSNSNLPKLGGKQIVRPWLRQVGIG